MKKNNKKTDKQKYVQTFSDNEPLILFYTCPTQTYSTDHSHRCEQSWESLVEADVEHYE